LNGTGKVEAKGSKTLLFNGGGEVERKKKERNKIIKERTNERGLAVEKNRIVLGN